MPMRFKSQCIALMTLSAREIRRVFLIWLHAILPPIITVTLYFIIFGKLVGQHMVSIDGLTYMQYIAPGLIAIPMITAAYSNTAISVYMNKFQRNIEELLISPMSNVTILLGFLAGSLFRVVLMTCLTMIVALFFTHIHIHNITVLILTLFLTSFSFGLVGFLNGVFAQKMDNASFVPVFILTPLTYLGGVFYSIQMLPPFFRHLSAFNPVFYIIDAFRYGMLGVSTTNPLISLAFLSALTVLLLVLNLYVLKKGFGIRS
jgi:ABC-2 type transport system permease protein